MMKVKIAEVEKLMTSALTSTYYSQRQAKLIAEVLLYAELTGKNTQGILKLLGTEPIQSIKPNYAPKRIKETMLSALIDGGGNPGALVSQEAITLAIRKCQTHGMSFVGTKNTYSSTGAIGYYAYKATQKGLIGIVMAGSPATVAPHGSLDPIFGTNPMAFGFPTMNDPIIFDMATAAITWYGLVRAKTLGEKIPSGVAIDKEGNLTTDPAQAMEGAIVPFDKGYKGSGLGMVVQLFTGPLTGALFFDIGKKNGDWGNVFIAIDPDLLIGKAAFKKNCTKLVEIMQRSRLDTKISDHIRIPGETSLAKKREVEKTGTIEIEDYLYHALQKVAL